MLALRCLLPMILATGALLACAALASDAAAPAVQMQTIVPAQTDRPLVNPGMGIYEGGTLNPEDMPEGAWYRDVIAIGYFRDDWADLEPEAEGQYRFDAYFQPIFDLWVNQWHKRVAFRFMCSNMHSSQKYVSPKWVFDAGVPFVVHKGLYVPEQIDPVFWDDRYLRVQERFIADLGAYLDGKPGVEFIDIGSIGEWGEMHLSRWTPEELQQTGYTEEKYIAAYRRIIDAFARAFPHTRVFLNVGDFGAINDYAALRGMHFRQDGLTPSGPSADVGNRFFRPYAKRGVMCNYEFHSGYDDMVRKGWGIRETFEKGLQDPISYLHINVTGYSQLKDPPTELKESILDAARRIGYRFVLKELRTNSVADVDGEAPGRLILEQTWQNAGVAPCYESYALRWSLVDAQGGTAAEGVTYPRTPTDLWWPGEEVKLFAMLPVPAGTAPGSYHVMAEMVQPERPGVQTQLGLAERDGQGRYEVGTVQVARAPRRAQVVYRSDFSRGPGDWRPAPGLQLAVAKEEGAAALVISGTQPGQSWQHASLSGFPALPYSHYRLTAWMKVDRLEGGPAPCLKIGVNARDGKWITNFTTNAYDLSRLGTWQKLTTDAETAPEAGSVDVCVERTAFEGPITANIRLRDVTLEVVDRP